MEDMQEFNPQSFVAALFSQEEDDQEMAINYGVIGGTGVYNPQILTNIEELTVETPYGDSCQGRCAFWEKVAFLASMVRAMQFPHIKLIIGAILWL